MLACAATFSCPRLIKEYWQPRFLSICTLPIGCNAHQAFRMCCKHGCWVHLIVSDFIWYIFWFITTSVVTLLPFLIMHVLMHLSLMRRRLRDQVNTRIVVLTHTGGSTHTERSCPHRAMLTQIERSCPHRAIMLTQIERSCPHRAMLTQIERSCPHRAMLTKIQRSCPHRAIMLTQSNEFWEIWNFRRSHRVLSIHGAEALTQSFALLQS